MRARRAARVLRLQLPLFDGRPRQRPLIALLGAQDSGSGPLPGVSDGSGRHEPFRLAHPARRRLQGKDQSPRQGEFNLGV